MSNQINTFKVSGISMQVANVSEAAEGFVTENHDLCKAIWAGLRVDKADIDYALQVSLEKVNLTPGSGWRTFRARFYVELEKCYNVKLS